MSFFNKIFLKQENNLAIDEIKSNNAKRKIIIKGDNNSITLNSNENLSPELNNKLNKRNNDLVELTLENEEKKIKEIKEVNHLSDIHDIYKFSLMTNEDVYKIIKDNNLIDKIVVTQEQRIRNQIKESLEFLSESSHEEKSILVWMTIFRLFANPTNFNYLTFCLPKVREKYKLTSNTISIESRKTFAKYGIFEQGTINNVLFDENHYVKNNFGKHFFNFKISEIYDKIPEAKLLYNDEIANGSLSIKSIISYSIHLHDAALFLLKDLGIAFSSLM